MKQVLRNGIIGLLAIIKYPVRLSLLLQERAKNATFCWRVGNFSSWWTTAVPAVHTLKSIWLGTKK